MAKNEWTRWYKFSEVFEHHGWIADNSQSNYNIQINNKTGKLHTDGGFRLKSLKRGSLSDYHDPKDEDTCPLKKGDLGLYWIHIKSSNGIACKDYIGKSDEVKDGIMKRLIDHFQKLSVLPSRSIINNYRNELKQLKELERGWDLGSYNSIVDVRSAFKIEVGGKDKLWKETHSQYMEKGVDLYTKFNDDLISICFYKMNLPEQMEDFEPTIEQAEAWAHLNFVNEYGSELNLNVVYEGKKFNGNPSDVMKSFAERLNDIYPHKTPLQLFKDRVAHLPKYQQGVIEYLESKNYNSTSDLLMHVIADGTDMRFSAPYYQHNDLKKGKLGDGSNRRVLITLAPRTKTGTFLCRSYLSPEDFNDIEIFVEKTKDGEPLNSQFIIDERITAKKFEDILIGTFKKWRGPGELVKKIV